MTSRKNTLCMVFEAIGPYSAIGRVAMSGVQQALAAGWQVSVVAKRLHESLQGDVEWLRLTVPRRVFLLQWATARMFIKQALGGRTFDIVHAHQPQAASLSDVFQCHYLTRAAYERRSLQQRPGLWGALAHAQELGVLRLEDFYYRHWNQKTRMLFDSELTRQDFARLYGMPPQEQVLTYAAPPLNLPSEEERRAARRKWAGDPEGIVIGYLGGLHERKGYKRLIEGLNGAPDITLLIGGQYTEGFQAPELSGRVRALGLVEDTAGFYAACDALIVPSHYEPFGLVALEAAARGVPVIATPEVGALPHLLEYGAGAAWSPGSPLPGLVRQVHAQCSAYQAGAARLVADWSAERQGERLLAVYDDVLRQKREHQPALPLSALAGETCGPSEPRGI